MSNEQELCHELERQKAYFIGFLEGLLCYTENGADPSKTIKEFISELEDKPESV